MVRMQPGWLLLSFAVAAGIVWKSDLTHFTWWQVIQFAFYCALAAFQKHDRYVLVFATQAGLTIAGVIGMSATGCHVLRDAADEWGAAYVVLNFAVHYAPLLIVYAVPPKSPPHRPALQVIQGFAWFVVYVGHHNGPSVYGCNMPGWPIVVGTALLATVLCIPVVLDSLCTTFTAFRHERVKEHVYAAIVYTIGL